MSIRPATDADADSLHELWQEFQQEMGPDDLWDESWEEAWAELWSEGDKEQFVFIAEEGEAVGFASGRLRRPRVAYLNDLYVRPAVRRRGVAKALLSAMVAWARDRGAQGLLLNVEVGNADARAVYRRLGFRERSIQLLAELEPLERRVAATEKPPSVASTHVQTDDTRSVERALEHFAPLRGQSAWTHVFPPANGWVAVTDELCDRDRAAQRRLATELSDRLGAPVVALALEEDSVVRFLLFDRGRMVDEYLSVPAYYGPLSKADEIALAANPTLLARLTGADPARVRAVARIASSHAELPPARELLAQIAEVMKLEARIER